MKRGNGLLKWIAFFTRSHHKKQKNSRSIRTQGSRVSNKKITEAEEEHMGSAKEIKKKRKR